jgi:hypothetical protein
MTPVWPGNSGSDKCRWIIRSILMFSILNRQQYSFRPATTRRQALQLPAELHLHPGRYTWTATPQSNHAALRPAARPVIEETFRVVPA